MFKGVHHVGIGVSDMNRSIKFYGDYFGFTEVMFDYTGSLHGMEKVTGKPETKARVVMLKSRNIGPLGLGMIKLVHCGSRGNHSPVGRNLEKDRPF